MHFKISRCCSLAALMVAWFSIPAFSQVIDHETRFSVRFGGIEVAKAGFKIHYDEKVYKLTGSGKTTGLVEWFAPGKGNFESTGAIIENQLKPTKHSVFVKEQSKKPETLKMAFVDDRVSDVEYQTNKPRKKRVAPKYVPVEASHMAAVIDPASTLIIPLTGVEARDGHVVCGRRFPVFDGESRYDIQLSYKSTKPIKTAGYNGHAYVCRMRYIPVAGHKKGHRDIKQLAENKGMEIWLAPMAGVSVFSPIQIVVSSKYGRVTALPEYFGTARN